jgi:hypothetical protein
MRRPKTTVPPVFFNRLWEKALILCTAFGTPRAIAGETNSAGAIDLPVKAIIPPRLIKIIRVLLWGGAILSTVNLQTAEAGETTAVLSTVSDDYSRTKLVDGSYQPETYTFGEGGVWRGEGSDTSLDQLSFAHVAQAIAVSLKHQNYLPARDPKQTRLLIMVYWGRTTGSFEHYNHWDELEGRAFDLLDARTAPLLGYDSALAATQGWEFTALRLRRQELLDELEHNRYFVVLMAYDFRLMWKEKKTKLLWETRFSIGEQRNNFDQQLLGMAQSASRYFGQKSSGLIRKPLQENIVLGELQILGVESAKK